jgi:hypothetical protein
MKLERYACALVLALAVGSPASAQVYGSLGNFDVVNDTGHDCHGFEIEIEDASYDRSKIYSVFGLDRDFGVPPTSVVRYGAPTITDVPGFGVRVRYQAEFANDSWSARTPSGPYPNPGDSCWPFGNPEYDSGNLTCDHFGVATYGTPAKVNYRWLCDSDPAGHSGILTTVPAEVPPVGYNYQPAPPPLPGQPPIPDVVEVQIDAPDEPDQPDDVFGRAYWVQVYSRHSDHDVELDQLMVDDPEVPGEDEIETEWELFQEGGDQGLLGNQLFREPGDEALVLRFAFYEYVGPLKADGEADCSGNNGQHGPDDCGGLGDYVGAQMAAFDANPVPEPSFAAQSVVLLGLAGFARRRLRKR